MIFTEDVLIVSGAEKGTEYLKDVLNPFSCKITIVKSCSAARRAVSERNYDLVLINAPLSDESGERLAKNIASDYTAQVILVVKSDFFDAVSESVEDYGIITVAKPINRNILWAALKISQAAEVRLNKIRSENSRLMNRIEDIKIIDRAKCMLVSIMDISESEAHRHIEKKAMDNRTTRRAVAEEILKIYGE